jgi:hypothetical protein
VVVVVAASVPAASVQLPARALVVRARARLANLPVAVTRCRRQP